MKKTWIIIVVILWVLLLWVGSKYNTLVRLEESTKTAWSQVENVYQRRMDLIPNLVNTVKGAAAQESWVLISVVNARANATKMNVNINDAQDMAAFQQQQWAVTSALSKLLAVVENYPTLQSIAAYKDLMTQLEGTENRISVERMNFNNTAKEFNIAVRRFPTNIIANILGFAQTSLFEAQDGADKAPEVKF